jgi:hypothetical protein
MQTLQEKQYINHVPTQLKYWADQMYDAEFEERWRAHHEAKGMYEHYKALNDEGIEHEPNF